MRQRWLVSLMAMAVLPVAGVAVLASGAEAAPRAHATPASSTITTEVTQYGWNDNSPPGCETAYSGCAGGLGTYAKPTTFATDKAELAVGTLVYVGWRVARSQVIRPKTRVIGPDDDPDFLRRLGHGDNNPR